VFVVVIVAILNADGHFDNIYFENVVFSRSLYIYIYKENFDTNVKLYLNIGLIRINYNRSKTKNTFGVGDFCFQNQNVSNLLRNLCYKNI